MSYPYTLDEYQQDALRTAPRKNTALSLAVLALGMTGEAGEVADLVKKHLGHGHPLDRDAIKKELGDVLWYLAALAERLNLTLPEIAEANINKLRARYPNGFSKARSRNR